MASQVAVRYSNLKLTKYLNEIAEAKSLVIDDLQGESKGNKPMYVAEVANAEGRIQVTMISANSEVRFCRLFHAICDVERWLLRLARRGLSARDRTRLLEHELLAFDIDAFGPIQIVDYRQLKRCALPAVFM